MAAQEDDGEQAKQGRGTPERSKSTIENATPITESSCAPPAKRQRLESEGEHDSNNEGYVDDILELLSNKDVVSALDDLLNESGSTASQTTFCEKNKKKKKNKKKRKRKNSARSRVLSIESIVIDIMKYLTIKDIISNRAINQFLNNLLHFKFICDNHNVYFEYSKKMLIDIAVKHQICDNIRNIALWYFASLNRTSGQPIFEREKSKENDCNYKTWFDNGNGTKRREKIYLCSINCRTKSQIEDYPWLLSSLLPKFSMNETTGDCKVLPFEEMYGQLKNIKEKVKDIANSEEKHVFGDVVSYCICFWCLYFCFYLQLYLKLYLIVVLSCKDCAIQLMLNSNYKFRFSVCVLDGRGNGTYSSPSFLPCLIICKSFSTKIVQATFFVTLVFCCVFLFFWIGLFDFGIIVWY